MTSLSAPPSEDLPSVLTSQQQSRQPQGTSLLADKISRQPVLVWRTHLSQKALSRHHELQCESPTIRATVKIYSQAGLTC